MAGSDAPAGEACDAPECDAAAAFRFYDRPERAWRPLCDRHATAVHPSLEIHALLESGYLRPVERPPPDDPPPEPPTGRAAAFREMVEAALGWTG